MDVYKYWKHSSGLKELIQSLCSSWTQIQEILILPCRRTKVLSAKVVALCHTWQPANAKRLSPCTTKIQLTHAFGKAWGYCSTQHLFEHLQHEQQCYGRQHRIIKKFKQKQKKKKKDLRKQNAQNNTLCRVRQSAMQVQRIPLISGWRDKLDYFYALLLQYLKGIELLLLLKHYKPLTSLKWKWTLAVKKDLILLSGILH